MLYERFELPWRDGISRRLVNALLYPALRGLASAGRGLSGDGLNLVCADLLLERSLPREALDEYAAILEARPNRRCS
jgi:hypothetical protein